MTHKSCFLFRYFTYNELLNFYFDIFTVNCKLQFTSCEIKVVPGYRVVLMGYQVCLTKLNKHSDNVPIKTPCFICKQYLSVFVSFQDWWNSNCFSSYYRMWNVVVHDWLHEYIYKDLIRLFGKNYRSGAAMAVFFMSAVVHEYVLAIGFRFFYPALLMMFGGVGSKCQIIYNTRTNRFLLTICQYISCN